MTALIRPFANGTEYSVWTSLNCDHCGLARLNTLPRADGGYHCPIEEALDVAYWDEGTIPVDLARRMGQTEEHPIGAPCPEKWAR